MKAKHQKKTEEKALDVLIKLIENYAEASRADEMKGGGDPDNYAVIEASRRMILTRELELARAKLNAQIEYLRRLFA